MKALTLSEMKRMLSMIIPILKYLHQELGYLYIDFSPKNIGIQKNHLDFYMFDFEEIDQIDEDTKGFRSTERYDSINKMDDKNLNVYDDFESLGFLLLDSFYGIDHSPLGSFKSNVTKSKKKNLIKKLRNDGEDDFFSEYFKIILDDENVYDKLIQLSGEKEMMKDLQKLTVSELKDRLKMYHLSTNGKKMDLINRLIEFLQ